MSLGPDPQRIREMFRGISGRYDLANSVLSLGIHRFWRRALVEWSGAHVGDRVLDCATGTGDLAIEFMKVVGSSGLVIGSDFCEEMVDLAKNKVSKLKIADPPKSFFEVADILELPYDDHQFDVVSVAFGIRNVSDPIAGLRELGRVLKPGGVLMVLEFGQVSMPLIEPLYRFYSKHLLPRVGGILTGDRAAYTYLQKSSQEFPCREEFVAWMHKSGRFDEEEFQSLTGGVAYLYKARRSVS